MELTLVTEETEDTSWQNEILSWEASIMRGMGYVETKEEWLDFQDHMIDHALAWMQVTHDEKHHGK